jgi:tRNA U34 2-thiouridine synthase MnmA/TrmU
MPNSAKAIVLVSGGLDSALTLKLLHDQNIGLIAVNFAFPTLYKATLKKSYAQKVADKLKIPFKKIPLAKTM